MKFLVTLLIIASVFFGFRYLQKNNTTFNDVATAIPSMFNLNQSKSDPMTVIASNLDTPWAIAFLPTGNLIVTERAGEVSEVNVSNGSKESILKIDKVKEIGEGGLLGVTLDPDFKNNSYVYFYYTYSSEGENTLNKLVRMKYVNKKLSSEEVLIDKIPGASNHNGGRIKFGPDKYLYITTGDADVPSRSQDTSSLAGKILRVTSSGKAAPGNPFGNEVYSYGHRNPQGITWDKDGNLWETEHGRSGALSGFDELNKIEMGKNYGWKIIQGSETKDGMVTPVLHSGATNTWAPAGLAYLDGSFFWGGLRGKTLYEGVVSEGKVNLKEHLVNDLGRIREVILGPDNMIYITTSNKDGRGAPNDGDDKIIRVNPKSL